MFANTNLFSVDQHRPLRPKAFRVRAVSFPAWRDSSGLISMVEGANQREPRKHRLHFVWIPNAARNSCIQTHCPHPICSCFPFCSRLFLFGRCHGLYSLMALLCVLCKWGGWGIHLLTDQLAGILYCCKKQSNYFEGSWMAKCSEGNGRAHSTSSFVFIASILTYWLQNRHCISSLFSF